jgi:hypothetical protein
VNDAGGDGANVDGSGPGNVGPLATACEALQAGEMVDFASGSQSAFSEGSLSWETAFYHDDHHGLIHLMGKTANADQAWEHETYSVATNEWTVVADSMWNNPGHIYGNLAMDFVTGDLFQARGGMDVGTDDNKRIAWWRHATQTWDFAPTTQDLYPGGLVSHSNGVAYHPNLYGAGDGGLIVEQQFRTMFWRKSDDAIDDIAHGDSAYGNKEGAAVYWPAKDMVVIGGSDDGGITPLASVVANGGGQPIIDPLGNPPIRTAGHSHLDGPGFGSLHVHPGNPDKLLIVETAGSQAWTSIDGSTWTAISDHPFTRVPRVVSSLRAGLGCLWAIGNDTDDGGDNFSVLWKPAP